RRTSSTTRPRSDAPSWARSQATRSPSTSWAPPTPIKFWRSPQVSERLGRLRSLGPGCAIASFAAAEAATVGAHLRGPSRSHPLATLAGTAPDEQAACRSGEEGEDGDGQEAGGATRAPRAE